MKVLPVKFYEGEYAVLSNFSAHQIRYKGTIYQTAEHAYQYQKFSAPQIKKKIKNAKSAFLAREYGQTEIGRKKSFDKVRVMKEIMRAKLLQHNDVKEALIKSKRLPIVKNHPRDSFWGAGKNGRGKNMMGKIWMELRKEMR